MWLSVKWVRRTAGIPVFPTDRFFSIAEQEHGGEFQPPDYSLVTKSALS